MRAGALAVVDARGTSGGTGHDVVALPDRRIAERASTAQIAPAQETGQGRREDLRLRFDGHQLAAGRVGVQARSEEHTSELQSRGHLVCRLLLEKKKTSSGAKR